MYILDPLLPLLTPRYKKREKDKDYAFRRAIELV